jgi:hypothetical protein
MAGGNPRVAIRINVGCRPPLNLSERTRAMRGNLVLLVEPANQLRAPSQEPHGVVAAERQPVEGVGVAAIAVRRVNRFPVTEAVTVPGTTERLDCAVFRFQPLAELGLRRWAIAFLHAPLVPHIVAQHGWIAAVALDQSGQEFSGLATDIFVIQAKRRTAGGATAAGGRIGLLAVAPNMTCLGVFVPHPLGRARDDFPNDDLDLVLPFEFHHTVIVPPVILARRVFDRGPHEPVTENVDAHLSRGLVVAFPILFRRVRFSKIHCPKREHWIW